MFLPFVVNVGLYEAVEDDSFYTPGDGDTDNERDECYRNIESIFYREKQYSVHDDTYRLRPIPMASVATSILQGSSGSLNFLACDSLVPVNHTPILRFVSFFLFFFLFKRGRSRTKHP